jgi:ABC-2 type transport system permease protein
VDRLIALVLLRWRMDIRAILGARERALGLLLIVPSLTLGSLFASVFVFFGLRYLDRSHPELLLPVLSVAATGVGIFWVLSPLLAGVAFSETHDVSRLLHFPIPYRTLVVSSLLANLAEPLVLAKLPLLLAVAAGLTTRPLQIPFALAGTALSFAGILAASQITGLLLLGLARNRRLQDLALFLGLGLGFLLSLLPVVFLVGGGGGLPRFLRWLVATDFFAVSPFAWGVRAAVHAAQGDTSRFFVSSAAAAAAFFAALGVAAALVRRVYQGEVDLGTAARTAPGSRARFLLPGTWGTLIEKDFRITWRDPRLKALLLTGLAGPILLLIFWKSTGGEVAPPFLLFLATFTGIATFGSNAFALERRGLLLLFGFPVDRTTILFAKNMVAVLLRLPGLALLLLVTAIMAGPFLVAAVGTIALATMLVGAGADNFMSILFPVPVPEPGRSPYGSASGGRGLGAAVVALLLMLGAVAASSPFAFLAWLPWLMRRPSLWLLTLPLALAGAAAAYTLMVVVASRLLERREPDLIARVLGEE